MLSVVNVLLQLYLSQGLCHPLSTFGNDLCLPTEFFGFTVKSSDSIVQQSLLSIGLRRYVCTTINDRSALNKLMTLMTLALAQRVFHTHC